MNPFEFAMHRNDEHNRFIEEVVLTEDTDFVAFEEDHVIDGDVFVELNSDGGFIRDVELEKAERLGTFSAGDHGCGNLGISLESHS